MEGAEESGNEEDDSEGDDSEEYYIKEQRAKQLYEIPVDRLSDITDPATR
jgi:hypothetical protein